MSTSGVDRTDLNPEDAYDVDLRRIDPEERGTLRKGGINSQQGNVEKRMRAARSAGRYKQSALVDQPLREDGRPYKYGRVPFGSTFGGLGRVESKVGRQGGYGYADKPKRMFGRF